MSLVALFKFVHLRYGDKKTALANISIMGPAMIKLLAVGAICIASYSLFSENSSESKRRTVDNLYGLFIILYIEAAADRIRTLATRHGLRTREVVDGIEFSGKVLTPWQKS